MRWRKWLEVLLPSQLCPLFCGFLAAGDYALCADPAEDERHAHPLPASEMVPEPDYGEDHGEHFSGHGYGDQEEGGECGQCIDWFLSV